MADIRVLIISSDPLTRVGIGTLLSTQPGLQVVAQSSDDVDFGELTNVYRPDVALWDLGIKAADSIERLARWASSDIPTIVLLANESDAAQAWGAGARGLITRDSAVDKLSSAITAVSKGLVVTGPELATSLFPSRTSSPVPEIEELTPREVQVLKLMAEGQANKEIARRLGISEHTVKFHVNAILGKLHAQSRTEAVVLATRSGLVML